MLASGLEEPEQELLFWSGLKKEEEKNWGSAVCLWVQAVSGHAPHGKTEEGRAVRTTHVPTFGCVCEFRANC